LEHWTTRRKTAHGLAVRAEIVLRCSTGCSNSHVARELRLTNVTVGKWRSRFVAEGVAGLLDEPRSGAPRRISDAQVEAVIVRTLESTPRDATHCGGCDWHVQASVASRGPGHLEAHRPRIAARQLRYQVKYESLMRTIDFVDASGLGCRLRGCHSPRCYLVLMGGLSMTMQHMVDEAEIRAQLDKLANAIRGADLEGVKLHYAPDVVSFDVGPRLQDVGAEAKWKTG
jgi:transposase